MAKFSAEAAVASSVVFLGGDDAAARHAALEDLLGASGGEESETETVVADSRPPDDWFGLASTIPFFSERRVTVVRGVGRSEPGRRWDAPLDKNHPAAKAMACIPPSCLLVLVHDEDAGDEDRQKKAKATADQWGRLVTLAGGKSFDFKVDPAQTAEAVKVRAAELGKRVSKPAVAALMEMVSSKPSLALGEIEKVALYAGDEPEIRESHVRAAATPDPDYNVFKLIDSAVSGDSVTAVRQVRTLFGQSPSVAEQAITRVFPVLTGQLRALWQARYLLDTSSSPGEPSPEVEEWLTSKRVADEVDWKRTRLLNTAKRLDLDKIKRCLGALVRAEAEVKGSAPAYSPGESLERMVLEMCRICAPKR